MSDFRFLHAADIHLDSPLTGLSRYEGVPAADIRDATRVAFDNLIQFAIKETVDFIVIAGDLFDGDWKDMSTGLYFARAMGRLAQAEIPVYLLHGNHDAGSVLTKSLPWPPNVHRFGTRGPQSFALEHLGVALHGWSFAHQAAPENLVGRYPPAVPHAFNIGVLHTSLSGHSEHDRYAPCEVADLTVLGYDFWALGHVHEFARHAETPPIIFPGNLQGRNIRETGPKGAVLVEVEDRRVVQVERREFDVIRWARVAVDCTGSETIERVQARAREALMAARAAEPADRGVIARVVLEGETGLADVLADRRDALRDDVRAVAAGIAPDLWLEKLSVQARLPASVTPLAGELAGLLAGAEQDPELAAALATALTPFLTAAAAAGEPEPDDLRHLAMRGDWRQLAGAAAAALRARLEATG